MNEQFITEFVKWLHSLGRAEDGYAVIGELRNSSTDLDRIVPALMPWIASLDNPLPIKVAAAMFGLYSSRQTRHKPDLDPAHNLGWSSKRLMRTLHPEGDAHGVEKRFQRLLDSDMEHMIINLTWLFQMFQLHDVSVNWYQLLTDLSEWDDDSYLPLSKSVRMGWSRMFWGKPTPEENKI